MASRELHPDITSERRAQLLRRGVALFDGGRYFAAHEAWEEVWRSTRPEPRDLLRGLIQVAVGMYHGAVRKASAPGRRVLARGRRRIDPFGPVALGIDVDDLVRQAREWEAWLGGESDRRPPPPRVPVVDPETLR